MARTDTGGDSESPPATPEATTSLPAYDPFARGPFPVGVRTVEALDTARDRLFPCEVWYPAAARHRGQDSAPATEDVFVDPPDGMPRRQSAVRDAAAEAGSFPLIVYSHRSGGRRRQSSFLCTHLSSHGYVVAALDHSDVIAPELTIEPGESDEAKAAHVQGWIANRVPDIRFLLDYLLGGTAWDAAVHLDPARIGIVGHSFGGWTALATPETDRRISAVVALAPAGSLRPPPNVIPATLTFAWGHDVPTLYVVAEEDAALPFAGMQELFARTLATKRMVIMRRADHGHFEDEFIPGAGHYSPEEAHLCVRGLALCHLDATVRQREDAQRFWTGDVEAALALRGVEVIVHRP